MQTPQIIENAFDPDWQAAVEYAFAGGSQFPWQFSPKKTAESEILPWNSQFTHEFFADGEVQTPFWEIIEPILDVLNPLSLIRVKANLTIATAQRMNHEWHKDSDDSRLRSAIYYVNSCNGSTEFISGDMINSVQGQLVTFPADMEHRTWTHTDVQARAVVSVLYLARQ